MSAYFPALTARLLTAAKSYEGKTIAVLGHARPDGDCIGSQVALARLLRTNFRAHTLCVNQDSVPKRYLYLVHSEPFLTAAHAPKENIEAVLVDCADHARIGRALQERFPKPLLSIDHHLSTNHGAETAIVDSTAAATAELIAGIAFDLELKIDAATASALYAGIATDTGQFRFPCTTQRCFDIAGRLIALGADPAEAGYNIYERESLGHIRLLQHFLASLRLECEGRVCLGILPNGIFEKCGATTDDTEGLVDYSRSIDGVDIGILLEERGSTTKGSLRAKDPSLRVDRIAAAFGGGGHACAAGLTCKLPLEELQPKLLEAVRTRLLEIDTPNA